MPDRPVLLTGFMGSGKTSVGNLLSQRLSCRFVDLDAEIVKSTGRSINEIFAVDGEAAFRVLESTQLEQILSSGEMMVMATGGGVVISGRNRMLMRAGGVVVNLMVSLEQVRERLKACTDRPLLAGDRSPERIFSLMSEREHFYADADIRIDTDGKSVEDVAIEILCRLKGFFS